MRGSSSRCFPPASLSRRLSLARLASRTGSQPLAFGGLTLAGVGMLVIALGHGTAPLLIGLAVTGLGLGAFNPANNASIMAAAPGGYTGLVGGILNMTRGAGTALGVAIASVIYTAAAGSLTHSVTVFAALALAAGLTLGMVHRSWGSWRGRGSLPLDRSRRLARDIEHDAAHRAQL